LRSVQKAFEKLGVAARITDDPQVVSESVRVVLPGVGAFGDAMRALRERGLVEPIVDHVRAEKPFFGICMGLQLLFEAGLEGGRHEGLGILPGEVVRFDLPAGLKVPHMGWNTITVRRPNPILEATAAEQRFYFVHSFYAVCTEPADVIAVSHHGIEFSAAIGRGNVLGAQFHPEKSHRFGLALMRRFFEMPC
ncbi:MAG: imidazole glycerol phosphate synthase subunit HisH, partial [Planctomycetota bacterium]